jgi:signal transduction histidine kinase
MKKSIQTKTFIALTLSIFMVGVLYLASVDFATKSLVGLYNREVSTTQENAKADDQGDYSVVVGQDVKVYPGTIQLSVDIDSFKTNLIINTAIITVVAMLILIGSAYLLVSYFNRPIKHLTRSVKAGKQAKVSSSSDEVQTLSQNYNEMLSKLNGALSSQKNFNVSVAHELKTPLAIMKANIDVLNNIPEKNAADYQETIDIIHQSLNKMNAVIETLLDSSVLSTASIDDSISLDEILSDVVTDIRPYAKQHHVELEYAPADCPKSKGNEVLLYRAFYNLVENGIKYNKAGGNVRVKLECLKHGAKVTIADNGRGISDTDLNHIFEPFYRVEGSDKEGLGLGLSLVLNIIQRHSGLINTISKPSEGTIFEIELPHLI